MVLAGKLPSERRQRVASLSDYLLRWRFLQTGGCSAFRSFLGVRPQES